MGCSHTDESRMTRECSATAQSKSPRIPPSLQPSWVRSLQSCLCKKQFFLMEEGIIGKDPLNGHKLLQQSVTLSSSSSSPLPLSFLSYLLVDSLESPAQPPFVSSDDFVSGELSSSVISSAEPLSVEHHVHHDAMLFTHGCETDDLCVRLHGHCGPAQCRAWPRRSGGSRGRRSPWRLGIH